MTGLDIDTCHLLEVACLITDDQLNIVAEVLARCILISEIS